MWISQSCLRLLKEEAETPIVNIVFFQ